MKKGKRIKEGLAVAVFVLLILRFIFRIRGHQEVSGALSWIVLPILVVLVILHFGPKIFGGQTGKGHNL